MKKVCVITGSRAEYGLLSPLIKAIAVNKQFNLSIIVTGMHLSPEFGLTYKEIENDGYVIDEKVEMLLSGDTDSSISKSIGLGLIGFSDAFTRVTPDLVILLGDRFEIFSAAISAYMAKIPIAHLHGGEITEGATDEAIRHSISKMSYWHFTSTENYRKRVIQLGEMPERVFNVGALGIDNIINGNFLSNEELTSDLSLDLTKPFAIVTYHPVTLENNSAEQQLDNLLNAILKFDKLNVVFTMPNADANGRVIIQMIDDFVRKSPNKYSSFTSLGSKRYLSLMKLATLVIGNSSSGIIETPSFGIPTINIGDRQKGRDRAESIIDANIYTEDIINAIKKGLSHEFQSACKNIENVYGNGHTASKIIDILSLKLSDQNINLKKSFYDIPLKNE